MNKRVLVFLTSLFIYTASFTGYSSVSFEIYSINTPNSFNSFSTDFYAKINDKDLDFKAFKYALKGYVKLEAEEKLSNSKYLTIIDMSTSSNEERFFIIDMETQKVAFKSVVAHGKNSGGEFATKFSNKVNSHQSSIGFFKTGETYIGKHGISMRLDGLEYSNDNARARAVVIHQANYAEPDYIVKNGRLGRSFGCPSLPAKDYATIINAIKDGSCLFIYYPTEKYLAKSTILSAALTE